MRALLMAADGFEDLELFVPLYRLAEVGEVTVATPDAFDAVGEMGYSIAADLAIDAVNPAEFDLLLIPGGLSPAVLRLLESAVAVTRAFADDERRIAAIGHGPQLLLSAGVLSGKKITCSPAIRDDVMAAGAEYQDEPAVRDGCLLTGRSWQDLTDFCRLLTAA